MRRSNFVLVCLMLVLFSVSVAAFQGSSASYSSDNKIDSFTEDNADSASFAQRMIGGVQAVGQYVVNAFTGRFGILTQKTLAINITSHVNDVAIPRGNETVTDEDDSSLVPNSVNFTAMVFENGTTTGFNDATCYFYVNDSLVGNSNSNSSGHCTMNYSKSHLIPGKRNLSVNFSVSTTDSIFVYNSTINFSVVKYLIDLTTGNYRTSGCATGISTCYFDGDVATLTINVTETNETGSFLYDPQNVSANGTDASSGLHTNGYSTYPSGNITRSSAGIYVANATVDYSAGTGSKIRWVVFGSENNFVDLISDSLHGDVELCAADWGAWSDWSACASSVQTRSRTDSSSCSQVESQSCEDDGGSCFPAGTKILMADESYKNIEDVEVGDFVISYDEDSKENVVDLVVDLESPVREHMCEIVFENGFELKLTNEHPVYTLGGWKSIEPRETEKENSDLIVERLNIGDWVLFENLEYKDVVSIDCWVENVQTYNLKSIRNNNNFYADGVLAHNKGDECTWGGWGDWSNCVDDRERRTMSDGCGNTETEIRPCGCVPDWQCEWGVCEEGSLPPEENLGLGKDFVPVIEPAVIGGGSGGGGVFLSPEDPGEIEVIVQGMQSGVCVDRNGCEDDKIELRQCIIGLEIEYSPQNLFLTLANNTEVDFSVDVTSDVNSPLELKWYLDGGFREGVSGVWSLSDSFTETFSEDSEVKFDVLAPGGVESRTWEININEDAVANCNETWYCDWTRCDGSFKYASSCEELNECGTNLNKPTKKECSCIPDYDCGEWEDCLVNYDVDSILKGEVNASGLKKRTCEETKGCVDEEPTVIEKRECSLTLPVRAEISEWCFEEYVELYDINTNKLVSRIKENVVVNVKGLNIGFFATEFAGYCSYCFDRVRNYDEDEIDCGGSGCAPCIERGRFFDYPYYAKWILWLLLLILLAYLIYRNRERIRQLFVVSKRREEKKVRARRSLMDRLKSIRLPAVDLRIKFGKPKRVVKPAAMKVVKPRVPKPYGGLRKMLREWKKKPYYATSGLEHKLERAVRQRMGESRHKREMRRFEKARLREERARLRELRVVRRKARGRRLGSFVAAFFADLKHKRVVKKVKKERKRVEKRTKKIKRKSLFALWFARRRRQKIVRKHERDVRKRKRERVRDEGRRDREHRKLERKHKKAEKKSRRGKGLFSGIFAKYKSRRTRKRVERVHKKEAKKRKKISLRLFAAQAKSRKRVEKRRRKVARKEYRREKKAVRKEARRIKKRIRRKEVSSRELSDLRRKLREWQKKGYYSTTRLQKKLDKFEGKDVLKG